jgi:hypothetical protein
MLWAFLSNVTNATHGLVVNGGTALARCNTWEEANKPYIEKKEDIVEYHSMRVRATPVLQIHYQPCESLAGLYRGGAWTRI